VHFRVLLGHFPALSSRPDHEGVHGPLDVLLVVDGLRGGHVWIFFKSLEQFTVTVFRALFLGVGWRGLCVQVGSETVSATCTVL
jgi:hypothetical protein